MKTAEPVSPYYPPRARWYSRVYYPWFALRRVLHLDKIHLPDGISPLRFLASLVVPGFAFCAFRRRKLGWSLLAAYIFSVLLFIAMLGSPIANIGFGLAISVHAIGIFYLELLWLKRVTFRLQVILALATLVAVWLAIYWPLTRYAGRNWFMPLRAPNRVVIVSPRTDFSRLTRGDWVAYSLAPVSAPGGYTEAGYDWGPVLAVSGDRVEFGTNGFRVNGILQRSRPNMPTDGSLIVRENHWFVWPNPAINRHGNVDEATISNLLLQMAVVSDNQLVGRPFGRWFWRRQAPLPP